MKGVIGGWARIRFACTSNCQRKKRKEGESEKFRNGIGVNERDGEMEWEEKQEEDQKDELGRKKVKWICGYGGREEGSE